MPCNAGNTVTGYVLEAVRHRTHLLSCAKKFGTPQYALDEDALIRRADEFSRAFHGRLPSARFFFAFKSNDLPYQIKLLKGRRYNADVSSMFELELALRLGFRKIIFTAPTKTDLELSLAVEQSDRVVVNLDSLDELGRLSRIASSKGRIVTVCLRMMPAGKTPWSKFGLTQVEAKKASEIISKDRHLLLGGFHFHASWNKTPAQHVQNIKNLGKHLRWDYPAEELAHLRFIDIGGGFLTEGVGCLSVKETGGRPTVNRSFEKISKIDDFAAEITEAFKKHITGPLGRELELWVEPGRWLSSLPTYILLRVVSVRRGNVMVDGGINMVGSDSFNREYYPIVNLTRPSTRENRATIYGNLCDPDDLWGYSYFGNGCKPGDVLAVMHQGAYTFSTAWRWQRPTPAYTAFKGKKVALAKKAETLRERYAGCLV